MAASRSLFIRDLLHSDIRERRIPLRRCVFGAERRDVFQRLWRDEDRASEYPAARSRSDGFAISVEGHFDRGEPDEFHPLFRTD